MVATIHSLPPELIRLILAAAYPAYDEIRHRYVYLRATALVCTAWRSTSQELLWEDVLLHTPTARAAFEEAPRLLISFIMIEYYDDEGTGQDLVPLEQILKGVRGVEALHINALGSASSESIPVVLKLDSISGEGFKDLKYLVLDRIQLDLDGPLLFLPFALELLRFELQERAPPPPPRLLAMLCQPSLKALHLLGPIENDPILHNFLPVAPHLHTLQLHPSIGDIPFGPVFLRACSALQDLELDFLAPGWLEALSTPLTSLRLRSFDLADAESLVEAIRDGLVGVSKLKALRVVVEELHGLSSTLPANATEEGSVWRDLATICREKVIKIEEILLPPGDEAVSTTP